MNVFLLVIAFNRTQVETGSLSHLIDYLYCYTLAITYEIIVLLQYYNLSYLP